MEIDDWRTSGDAMYIAGELWVANAALAIWMKQGPNCKADAGICLGVALILPELSQREEVFSGSYPSFATHFAESRIHEIWTPGNLSLRISEFERVITKDVSLISHLIDLKEHAVEEDELLITLTMNTARERKNTEELKAIEYASRVATHVHRGIRDVLRHKIRISESTLAAQIKYHSTLCYTRLQAYPPIVGLGRHAAVLHYRVGEDESNGYEGSLPDQPEPSPQTLLVDAASEYMGYASDLTRTWPTRPAADTELIDMVKRIQAAAIKKIKEAKHDIHWSTLVEVATRTLAQELLSHGIFRKGVNVDEILDTQAWKMFMPHGLGHPVGLDVHDPIPNENFLADPSKPTPHHMGFAAPSSGSDYLIVPGMAFTIEPGIYFIPLLWNETSSAGQLVNWTRVREWAAPGVGGARHEDVVIMWHDGSVTVPTSEVV
ncbi:peptidase M24, structural domain-containing protein [Phlyctochytrium arcticum]|nr:peptidase M24, structural domain-containing protein [Phlyctochytrium arcticum]